MPLTAKGEEILAKMKSEYGDERGRRVFYASKNAGRIAGVDSEERMDALSKPFDGEMVDRDGEYRLLKGSGDDAGKWCVKGARAFRRFEDEGKARAFMKEKAASRGDSLLSEMDAITARLDAATDPAVRRALLVRMDSALDAIDAEDGGDWVKGYRGKLKKFTLTTQGHRLTAIQRFPGEDDKWSAEMDGETYLVNFSSADQVKSFLKKELSRTDAVTTNPEIESLVKEAKALAAGGDKGKAKVLFDRAERMQRDLMKKRGDAVEELPKESVDYSPGKGEDRCRNCVHFESPGACEIVEGEIDPDYWCKRFEVYRGDGVSDDLRDARARLAAAVAENQTAVAKALRAKIEELEAKHAAAPPELRGDDDDSRDDADPDELRQLERSLKYYGTHGILPNWPTVTAMTGEGSFKRSGQQGGLEKVRARIAELKKGRDDANPAREGSRAAKEDDARREELRRMVGTVKDPAKLERIKKELAEYEGGRFYDDRDDRNDAVHSKLDLALARAAKIMGRHFAKGTRADVDERYRLEWTTAKGREGEIKSHDLKDLTARFNSMKRQAQFESVALFDGTKLIGEN